MCHHLVTHDMCDMIVARVTTGVEVLHIVLHIMPTVCPRPLQTELRARRSNVGGTPMRPAAETAVNNELAALFAKRQALT